MGEHEELEALAVDYSLAALDPREQEAFERHLSRCTRCTALVAEYQRAAEILSLAIEEQAPSPHLRERVLAAVQVGEAPAARAWSARIQLLMGASRRLLAAPALAGLLLVLLTAVGGLAFWNLRLQHTAELSQTRYERGIQAIAIMSRATIWWRFGGTEIAPEAFGTLAYSERDSAGCLVLWNLPATDDKGYYAWAIRDGVPTRLGSMWTMGTGMWLIISLDPRAQDTLSVTLEEHEEPQQPQGPVVFSVLLARD